MTTKTIYSIYKHTSKTSGKSYIGVSLNTTKRKKEHNRASYNTNSNAYNYPFHRAIRKYGIDDFQTTILWQTPNEKTAYLAEVYFIAVYNTYHKGYNATKGGEHPPTISVCGKKHHNYGRKHTIEHKNKVKQSLSKIHKSNEFKSKISKISKTRWKNPEYRLKISKAVQKQMSKKYKIITPTGKKLIIINLKLFCNTHNLNYGGAYWAKNNNKIYKGYIIHNA